MWRELGRVKESSEYKKRVSMGSLSTHPPLLFAAESKSFRELDDVFLQTQTRIWLGEVLHTRVDEETPVADLLADGKLLFQVSKVVWKMLFTKCVKPRHSKAFFPKTPKSAKISGRYMPYSNVDSFLKVCQTLGLTGIDLFSPSDVVEKRNIRRVCMCIRTLSKKARSKNLNVPDFDVVTYTVSMPTDMVESIRRSFEDPKKYWGTEYARLYDSYSEASDDTESTTETIGSLDARYLSNDNHHFIDAQLDDMLSSSDLDYQINLKPGTRCVNKAAVREHFEDETNTLYPEDLDLSSAAFLLDSVEHCTSERHVYSRELSNSDLSGPETDGGQSTLSNGEEKNIVFNLQETSVGGSNLTYKTSRYQLGNRYPDEMEEVDISPTISGNSISDKEDTTEYGNNFGREDDFTSPDTQSLPQDQSINNVHVDNVSTRSHETQQRAENNVLVDSLTSNIDEVQLDDSNSKPIPVVECQLAKISDESLYYEVSDLFIPCSESPDYVCHPQSRVPRDFLGLAEVNPLVDDVGLFDETFHGPDVDVRKNLNNLLSSLDGFHDRVELSREAILPTKEEYCSSNDMVGISLEESDRFISNAIGCTSALEETTDSEKQQQTVSPSEKTASVLDMNAPADLLNGKSSSLVHSSLSSENSLLADNSGCEPMGQLSDHDLLGQNSFLQSSIGNVPSAESGDVVLDVNAQSDSREMQIGRQATLIDSSGAGNSNPSDRSHHSDGIFVSLAVPSTGDESFTASVSSETGGGNEGSDQNLVEGNHLKLSQEKVPCCMDKLSKDTENHEVEKCTGEPKRKPGKAVLLKSFAGGISLVGVIFLLFQLSKRSSGETNDETRQSSHISHASHEGVFRQKRRQARVEGVYPSEKLKFAE